MYASPLKPQSHSVSYLLLPVLTAHTPPDQSRSVTMGNTLAPMQRDLAGANSDSARDAKETLDRLEDMAQDRIDLFYDRIGYESP